MEAAACLRQRGLGATVVTPAAVPFDRVLGREVGAAFQPLHERHGTRSRTGVRVVEITHDGPRANGVLLATGERLPTDLIGVGVGVPPGDGFPPARVGR